MANFNTMQITNAGKNLYAKVQTGVQLNFTKIQLGSGNIGTQNPETLTALVTPKFDIAIQSVSADTANKQATISGTFTNTNVTATTYICEIGIFAQDPDNGEILYGYASAGSQGDYINPASSGAFSNNYQVIAAVGNATSVTATISNLQYDYAVVNSGTYTFLVGGNQKEINKSIDNFLKPYTTTNSGNVYSVTIPNLTGSTIPDGYPLKIKFNAASTGAITLGINSITAKSVKDYFNNNVTNVRQNLIANLCYESISDSFILLGKGGDGNATADVLVSPYTATTVNGPIAGTLADNYNTDNITAATSVSGTTLKMTIPTTARYRQGYHLQATDSDFIASNIVNGVNIFGLTGNYDPLRLIAGTSITLYDANVNFTTLSTTYVLAKSVTNGNIGGTVTVSFSLTDTNTGNGGAYGRIYVNNIAVGTERYISPGTSTTLFTENITINTGDSIEIYVHIGSNPSGGSISMSELKITCGNSYGYFS